MAGRISEYLDAPKLNGTELVDFSVVDGGSPTGYSTRKSTLDEVAAFNPTIYAANGDLSGNRTVNQDNYDINFINGDFNIESTGGGFKYDSLNNRFGLGENTPLAKLHLKGNSGENLFLIENSIGNDRFVMNENGQTGTGANDNASILPSFGHFNSVSTFQHGFGFYGYNCSGSVANFQMTGNTKVGINVSTQGAKTGTVSAIATNVLSIGNDYAEGGNFSARNGAIRSVGLLGNFSGGGTVSPSDYGAGLEGLCNSNLDSDQYGAIGGVQFNNPLLDYTKDIVGLLGKAGGLGAGASTSSNIKEVSFSLQTQALQVETV